MKTIFFAALLGVSTMGFAKTEPVFIPCQKTYVDHFCVDLNDKIIAIETGVKVIQTSALFSDEGGLYYMDFLEQPEEEVVETEEPVHEDLFTTENEDPVHEDLYITEEEEPDHEDLFTTDEQIDSLDQVQKDAPAPPKKQPPAKPNNSGGRGWPFTNRGHR